MFNILSYLCHISYVNWSYAFDRFDELHYGKFVGMYMKRIFFFDQHPPFGKQLVATAAYLAGFDG